MPSKVQLAIAKAKAKKKLKDLEKALEAQDSALIERILGKIDVPSGANGKDGRDAPELSEIVRAVTPLLPEARIEQTTVVEKVDLGEMKDFITGMLPEARPEDRPAVEQITNTIDVSEEKLGDYITKKELNKHLVNIQRAITASQSGGTNPNIKQRVESLEVGDTYDKLIDDETPIIYIGEAEAGTATSSALWRIKRIDSTNDPDVDIRWADGVTTFTKTWDDRATYTY